MSSSGEITIGLSAAIIAVTGETPRVLTVERSELGQSEFPALPFGPLDPRGDRTLELGLRGWVREQTGLELGYVEQLYTFGDSDRFDVGVASPPASPRVLSVAYLALMREAEVGTEDRAVWRDVYRFFPWEDWRAGRPSILEEQIEPRLAEWCDRTQQSSDRDRRIERREIAFGQGATGWDPERVLDRYELLYEACLVAESKAPLSSENQTVEEAKASDEGGAFRAMALDHRRILATAMSRLRGKLKYRPLVFEMMPPEFTLFQLQRAVEALAGIRLHKQNFRRLIDRGGLVEGTAKKLQTTGRPAELFRFRQEVLRERPALGVGLPASSP